MRASRGSPRLGVAKWLVALALLLPPAVQAQELVENRDYVELPNGRPLDSGSGIVVEEFFNYACPGCNLFEPLFVAWQADLPSDVMIAHVPASFRPDFAQYARAYYAAQSLGVAEEAHQAVYEAIHRRGTLPREGERPDETRIARFYAAYGVDADAFLASMQSFGVNAKVRRAAEHMTRQRILSTPSLVINGRYLVRGTSYADMLRIASELIARELVASGAPR